MGLDITLLAIDTHAPELLQRSIDRTLECVDCKEVLVLSHSPIDRGRWIKINPIDVRDYNMLMIKHLWPFITTEHVLVVQYDSMAVRGDLWTDDFLNYDYIGAWWPWAHHPDKYRVGNGGFSLRSRRLIDHLKNNRIQVEAKYNEDQIIGIVYRDYLEKQGIKFATESVAKQFSHEHPAGLENSFGFHGSFNVPYYLDEDHIEHFIQLLPVRTSEAALRMVVNLIKQGRSRLAELAIDLGQKQDPMFINKLEQVANMP